MPEGWAWLANKHVLSLAEGRQLKLRHWKSAGNATRQAQASMEAAAGAA
jgi:hypothetical protein